VAQNTERKSRSSLPRLTEKAEYPYYYK